jgi:hypothetical protein
MARTYRSLRQNVRIYWAQNPEPTSTPIPQTDLVTEATEHEREFTEKDFRGSSRKVWIHLPGENNSPILAGLLQKETKLTKTYSPLTLRASFSRLPSVQKSEFERRSARIPPLVSSHLRLTDAINDSIVGPCRNFSSATSNPPS